MTYDQAIAFWFGRINYEYKTPRPSDLSLERIRALLELLDRPQERYRIVHVAGSKGKGSTSAFLASVLGQAGFQVGLFTSPHLESIRERVQVNGAPISEEELAQVISDIAEVSRRHGPDGKPLDETLTFFEIATALGYLHFARRRIDIAVIEVGMGGRFDSTNVCRPALAIITSISFDHTRQLGNTLALIAGEKAGIIKPGRPVLSGVRAPEARAVIEQTSRARGAPLRQVDVDLSYRYHPAQVLADVPPAVEVRTWKRSWPSMRLGLIGEHQGANAALAVAAVECLREQGLVIADRAVERGLAEVHWPARLEVVGREPLIVLDCAHNVASAAALVTALETSFPLPLEGRRLLVFAGSQDKDLPGILQALAPHFDCVVLTRFVGNQRAADPADLFAFLPVDFAGDVEIIEPAGEAWRRARDLATSADLICVTGSVFLAGEVRPLLREEAAVAVGA
ncbi:MAG: folylpolyglutamate synthase/dihydrofolate synthase family protein [Gemmataceae bacterium]